MNARISHIFIRKNICPAIQIHTSVVLRFTTATTKPKYDSTVDQEDVKFHSKQMSDWWNPKGSMKALHSYNHIRVPFIRDGLVRSYDRSLTPLQDMKILDVGCGGGILSEPLARLGADVTGIDASPELVDTAIKHSYSDCTLINKPSYYCTTAEDHAITNPNYYDAVVASEIIEHVNNKPLFIKSCICALKPGGKIFFTTPCRSRLSKIFVIFLAERVLKIVPQGTHQIEKFMTPTELTFLLERHNCHVDKIFGIFYNVLTNTWQWVTSHNLMFALQATKFS